jgi:hypothetical protein
MRVLWRPEEGPQVELPRPPPRAEAAEAPGETCPACRKPLRLAGRNPVEGERTVESAAYCAACDAPLGRLVVELATLFGLEEDRAVLNGRCRVY